MFKNPQFSSVSENGAAKQIRRPRNCRQTCAPEGIFLFGIRREQPDFDDLAMLEADQVDAGLIDSILPSGSPENSTSTDHHVAIGKVAIALNSWQSCRPRLSSFQATSTPTLTCRSWFLKTDCCRAGARKTRQRVGCRRSPCHPSERIS